MRREAQVAVRTTVGRRVGIGRGRLVHRAQVVERSLDAFGRRGRFDRCCAAGHEPYPPRFYRRLAYECLSFFSSSTVSGTALNRSATSPKSATLKIGASGSLLIATMVLESFIPARCWIAPEMPTAT